MTYRIVAPSLVTCWGDTGVSLSTVRYAPFIVSEAGYNAPTVEAQGQSYMPFAAILRNFTIRLLAATSATSTGDIILRSNGADTAIVIHVPISQATGTRLTDATNIVTVAAGDLLCYKYLRTAGTSLPAWVGWMEVIPI